MGRYSDSLPVRAVRGAPPAWLADVRSRQAVSHVEALSLAERIRKAERALARLACLDDAEVSIEFQSFEAYAAAFEALRLELRSLYAENCR